MITVTARQVVKAGKEAELEVLMTGLAAKIRANEPGCVGFDYVKPEEGGNTRLVVERYRDDEAMEFHKSTEYLRDFIPKLLECLEEFPEVSVYRDVTPGPELPDSFFHVGIVVPDLPAAIARYSEVFGIEFTEPATFKVPRLEDPEPHPFELVCAFSKTGAPYYELIQADGDGIVSAENAGKILYYGVWEDDMAGRLDILKKQGVGVDALFRKDADSTPFAVITAPDLMGARIEYVDTGDRGPIDEWVRTGVYPGGLESE
ncbi:antibiotic biosynthesis monooxygenase [Streptomyces sp. NBC_00083]|uniref:antibiotic biosynthesis monooxygenase n=1 Tax=Streptomyces sp. NBC_00083 TaxID=2975647 RepID=UPI0022548AD9|nr:antibiotic biosynthesis monooxygenase [Streptomyces sp. NBC_00083]MCX5388220.1 VOC family protein [Streptomyces sp. NBC_00083]